MAVTDGEDAYRNADMVIVATPTYYDSATNRFDTSAVESVVEQVLGTDSRAFVVIKSTVPVDFTMELNRRYHTNRILFSPEFLRETRALYDNLHPSRIIVGCDAGDEEMRGKAERCGSLLSEASLETQTPVLLVGTREAEAAKLFANTYLALRVSFSMNWTLMRR